MTNQQKKRNFEGPIKQNKNVVKKHRLDLLRASSIRWFSGQVNNNLK